MTAPWKPGDRVTIRLKDTSGDYHRAGTNIVVHGVVRAIDEPGLPRGVRVDLDHPISGISDCYATYSELRPEVSR